MPADAKPKPEETTPSENTEQPTLVSQPNAEETEPKGGGEGGESDQETDVTPAPLTVEAVGPWLQTLTEEQVADLLEIVDRKTPARDETAESPAGNHVGDDLTSSEAETVTLAVLLARNARSQPTTLRPLGEYRTLDGSVVTTGLVTEDDGTEALQVTLRRSGGVPLGTETEIKKLQREVLSRQVTETEAYKNQVDKAREAILERMLPRVVAGEEKPMSDAEALSKVDTWAEGDLGKLHEHEQAAYHINAHMKTLAEGLAEATDRQSKTEAEIKRLQRLAKKRPELWVRRFPLPGSPAAFAVQIYVDDPR